MHEIIGIVFDFDDTLAPDSTSGFLNRHGVDVPKFWKEEVQPLLDEDWDPIPAYLYKMIEKSNTGEICSITKDSLIEWGREITLYGGVETIFDRLRDHARKISPRVALNFYLISSGIGEVLRSTKIAHQFDEIWASDFIYDSAGRIIFPKKVVSFTDKTRYIFHIQKGIFGPQYRGKPFDVNRKFDNQDIRIPLNQMSATKIEQTIFT